MAVSRSSPRAADSALHGPAAGSPCRSWPCTCLAPGSALSSRGRSPGSPCKRPAGLRSRDAAPERALNQVRAHPGPETNLLRVWGDSEEVRPLHFRHWGGTSVFPTDIAGAVPWRENSPEQLELTVLGDFWSSLRRFTPQLEDSTPDAWP